MNVHSSTSLQISEGDLKKETASIEKLEIFIKDGHGLTVEIYNNGDTDAENIQLTIDVEVGKLVIIP